MSDETEVVKDLNWFKKQLDDIEMNPPRLWTPDSIWILDKVYEVLNQLDETEVLSSDWIDKNVVHVRGLGDIIEAEAVKNLIVPQPVLPTIPKFVADAIEVTKMAQLNYYDMLKALEKESVQDRTRSWVFRNLDTFAKAWLYGYTIKKEPKYVVRTNLGTYLIIDTSKREWDYTSIPPQDDDIQYAYKFDDRSIAEGIAKLVEGKVEVWEE